MQKLVRVVVMDVMYILITLYQRLTGKNLRTFLHLSSCPTLVLFLSPFRSLPYIQNSWLIVRNIKAVS